MAGIPSVINLGSPTADTRIFRLDGAVAGDSSGYSVSSAGDVNGDGYGDIIVGAYQAAPNGSYSGSSYVVYGGATNPGNLNLGALTLAQGFRLDGAAGNDISGYSVSSAGDVNGDGYDDLLVGAPGSDASSNGSGSSYVVYGGATNPGNLNLGALTAAQGFRLDGAAAGDFSGLSVSSAGDVNGDGYDDLIIGAYFAHPNGSQSGSTYVVYGGATNPGTLNLGSLTAAQGFRLDGAAANDRSGYSVSSAGDVNGDGYDDLLIGAYQADPNGSNSGSSYVVYGGATNPGNLNLGALTAAQGFRLDGAAAGDVSGYSVSSAGDVNGDGYDDLIIGASGTSPNGGQSGSSYVVYGGSTNPGNLNLGALTAAQGFRLDGAAELDFSGLSVSSAGDVNGDGFDDLIIGAYGAGPNGAQSGSSYVVYGGATNPGTLNVGALTAAQGFRLDGAAAYDNSGLSVSSAGDVDGDGYDELIIGAPYAAPNGPYSGSSYVVFGEATAAVVRTAALDGAAYGGDFADILSGVGGAERLFGRDGDDTLVGGAGADSLDGGAGTDTASYATSSGRVSAALSLQPSTDNDAQFDTLVGIENLTGSDFDDGLFGDLGDNVLDGGAGDDALYGQGGADTLIGGTGRDTVFYSIANTAGITVNLALGTGLGGQAEGDVLIGVENVSGGGFADLLVGDANANVLNGEAGEDTLIGGAGADTLQGSTTLSGADVDTVDYSASFAGVTVSLLTGTGSAGDAEGDVLIVIENLVGSGFNDVLIGAAGANSLLGGKGDDLLLGGSGADVLDGGLGPDTVSYITSTAGVRVELATGLGQTGDAQGDILRNIERVSGSNFGDTLTGGTADDVLLGLLGDDLLAGGDGDDFLVGGGGADRLNGGNGLDTASYAASTTAVLVDLIAGLGSGGEATGDTLVGVERVFGSQFSDTLIGGASSDVLLGDLGADLLRGGGGADVLVGGAGFDTVDYLTSDTGVTAFLGGAGVGAGGDAAGDVLLEVEGLTGSAFNDVLVGDAGRNVIIGGAGSDYLLGRGGADVLVGGAGTDRFVFATLQDSTPGPGVDLVADFSRGEGDLIDFSPLLAGLGYRFIGGAGFSGTGPELRSEALGDGRFLVETDAGEGTADLRIVVQTVDVTGNLVASDFVF
ncbi:beta strand repeat-containing protein [Muricoccus radiodurans]|uniref:beta strand repeat-containing protein n=1 Tax=Muricoccus radiodurans TaxID=2231721 RepID=UPI003CEBC5BB